MATIVADAMYTGSTQPGSTGGYSSYEHRPGYPGSILRSHSYGRPPIDPPRPLEPRPTLHTSHSESSGASRHNLSHGPLSPEHRPQGQNLPALRDILSPGPHPSSRSPYSGTWSQDGAQTSSHSRSDSHYYSGLHPPMSLYPPSDMSATHQPPHSGAFEVPILNTSPVAKHPPQSLGMPTYTNYGEPRHEYGPESRSDKQPTELRGSYLNNTVHQYTPATPDDSQYRSGYLTHDQAAAPPYTPTGSENRGSYLGVQEFPGDGTYYVYDNGHRIPTHVDGEQVNPAWGLTKANKPRKRLALACLDCREKKIKCEPGASSCLQCEKAKRTCRRAPTQTSQPDTPAALWGGNTGSPVRNRPSTSDPTPSNNRDTEPDPLNKRRSREDPSPPNVPTKKHRSVSPIRTSQDTTHAPREGMSSAGRDSSKVHASSSLRLRQSEMQYEWDVDPYSLDPGLTLHLVNLYFAHVNNATYCIYPRGHFIRWLQNYPTKCQNERMVLYAMLALGTIFSDDNTLAGLGKRFALIAGDAVASQAGKFNISMAQAHMILSLYHFAKGDNGATFSHYGSAIQQVRHQCLNTEKACLDDSSVLGQSRVEYAFSRDQLAECKRRTFWSAFLMDRYRGANTCDIKPEDLFLRLPCTDDMYERSVPSDAPFFSNGIIDPSHSIITASSPIAPMAWLVIVAVPWGNVLDFTFRSWFRSSDGYGDTYKAFYDDTTQALQGWHSRLPPYLQYSVENLDRSIQQGYAGTLISMHTLYHLAQIKMNRYLRHATMSEVIPRNLKAAHENAHEMLQLAGAVGSARKAILSPAEGQPTTFSLSTPFPGYATLAAIDIVSAGGWEWMLGPAMQKIWEGLNCMRELSKYWASASEQLKACEKRYYQIQNILSRRRSKEGAWLGKQWGMENPLEQDFEDPEYDCVWGLGDSNEARRIYWDSLKRDESSDKPQPGGLRIV